MIHTIAATPTPGLWVKDSGPEITIGDTVVLGDTSIVIAETMGCRPHPAGNSWVIPHPQGGFIAIAERLEGV